MDKGMARKIRKIHRWYQSVQANTPKASELLVVFLGEEYEMNAFYQNGEDVEDGFFNDGDIVVDLICFISLTISELKAVITHEMGHAIHGPSEITADDYAIECGYGPQLASALIKGWAERGSNMDLYLSLYESTPNQRIARLMGEQE